MALQSDIPLTAWDNFSLVKFNVSFCIVHWSYKEKNPAGLISVVLTPLSEYLLLKPIPVLENLIMGSLKCWWPWQILEKVNLLARAWKSYWYGDWKIKETKPIYLFPGLYVCGDRVSVPLTSLKNMPGESILPWLSAKTACETAGDNSGFLPPLNSWCSEAGWQLSGCVLSHRITASPSAAPVPR